MVSRTPRPHFTPGKDPVPILQEAGWAPGPVWTGGKSRPHRDSIPDRPASRQSLYRLSYPAHTSSHLMSVKSIVTSPPTNSCLVQPNILLIKAVHIVLVYLQNLLHVLHHHHHHHHHHHLLLLLLLLLLLILILLPLLRWHYSPVRTFVSLIDFSQSALFFDHFFFSRF